MAAEVAVIVAVIVVMVVPMTVPVAMIMIVVMVVSLTRGGADMARVVVVMIVVVVMPVIVAVGLVVVVMPVVVVVPVTVVMIVIMLAGTTFDGEVQRVWGEISSQRAAKPAEYASSARRSIRRGVPERGFESDVALHDVLRRI